MTLLKTNVLSIDISAECWQAAADIVPPGNAFSEEFWNAAARQMLTGLILHVVESYPAEKHTVESLLALCEHGVESIDKIRATSASGAVRAWLHPVSAGADGHYTAAVLAECAANLHRFLLAQSPERSRP